MPKSARLKWVLLETPPWGHGSRFPGHHLAEHLLARGHRVAYVSAPVSPWHFLSAGRRNQARARWAESRAETDLGGGLHRFVPRTLSPLNRQFPFDNGITRYYSERLTFPRLKHQLRQAGFGRPDVIVMHNQQMPCLLDVLPHRVFVFRMEDDTSAFPNMPRTIIRNERDLMLSADMVTATAHTLAGRARDLGARHVHYLPNGVDLTRFRRPEILPARPKDLPDGPCAFYVGTIDSWFDQELLITVAARLPEWNFVLAGPQGCAVDILRQRPNIHLLGPVPQEKIPPYLYHSTAGLIPFRRNRLVESVCPLKLFEYLAAGLPVVSTRWTEMEALGSPARLATDAETLAEALVAAASATTVEREEAMRWAEAFSWPVLLQAFEEEVQALVERKMER